MGSSSPQHLLCTLCLLLVLSGLLPPTTAQWFNLGLEDATPEPGTSPTAPTAHGLDGDEGRHDGMGHSFPGTPSSCTPAWRGHLQDKAGG